ncbi:hypothetical protein KR026_002888 [Drosophila bipectinata]|nr:hypothetical protein KR026_002888 [Drosophila bipectinata]
MSIFSGCFNCNILKWFECWKDFFAIQLMDSSAFKWFLAFAVALLFLFNVHSAVTMCDVGNRVPQRPNENVNEEEEQELDRGNGPRERNQAEIGAGDAGQDRSNYQELVACTAYGVPNGFDYGMERGPHTWNTPCNNQSPINIDTDCLATTYFDCVMEWGHYDDIPMGIRIENDGHTLFLRAAFRDEIPYIGGADLLGRFEFREIRFRWSWYNSSGSEHTIDNHHYPLEMQCLHVDDGRDRCTSSQGILMISYMFELSEDNPLLDVLIQHLVAVQSAGQAVEVPPFPLSYLMLPFFSRFYSYHGSLTEPPCHRGAEWMIFPLPLAIGERQLNEFRQLKDRRGVRIAGNARPVQPLANRSVFLNRYTADR